MNSSPDPIFELGKQLADALGEHDTLGQWMAHYVAELITTAEQTDDSTSKSAAADFILRLWDHRSNLKNPYPLKEHDKIFAALDYLGLPANTHQFNRHLGAHQPSKDITETDAYLRAAAALDDINREVVSWLIHEAALNADDREAPWVDAAMQLEADPTSRLLSRLHMFTDQYQRTRSAPTPATDAQQAEAELTSKVDTETDSKDGVAHSNEEEAAQTKQPVDTGDTTFDMPDDQDPEYDPTPDPTPVDDSDDAYILGRLDEAARVLDVLREAVADRLSGDTDPRT